MAMQMRREEWQLLSFFYLGYGVLMALATPVGGSRIGWIGLYAVFLSPVFTALSLLSGYWDEVRRGWFAPVWLLQFLAPVMLFTGPGPLGMDGRFLWYSGLWLAVLLVSLGLLYLGGCRKRTIYLGLCGTTLVQIFFFQLLP